MYSIPSIFPYDNLALCKKTIRKIKKYECHNKAIGQLYPNGGPDEFTYFFSMRGIPIFNYLRGNISMGDPSAYAKNIEELEKYINWAVLQEVQLVDQQIGFINEYKSRNWAIGELYPDGGPDGFVVFFAQRDLPIAPYLRGSVSIGYPSAYDKNIKTLLEYKKLISCFNTL